MTGRFDPLLADALATDGAVVVVTGAGISVDSGIPTFRGADGYWRVGSRNYQPQELATHAAFTRWPAAIWGWYLYRRSICRAAEPNDAHRALVRLESRLADRFVLVTQNVDGLHLRAGSHPERTLQIHGNIDFVRCIAECTPQHRPIPLAPDWQRDRLPTADELRQLSCPLCGAGGRPHVLWFDECYDEERFRYDSAMRAAAEAALLIIAGSSGSTTLPMQMAHLVARRGAPIITVDPQPTPFAALATGGAGANLVGTTTGIVPDLVERIIELAAP